MNVPARQEGTGRQVNIPVDAAIMPKDAQPGDLPLFVEAKSAGDFTNVNKRRKEEATKIGQLRLFPRGGREIRSLPLRLL